MSLRAVHAFGRVFDVDVSRSGDGVRIKVTPDSGATVDAVVARDASVRVIF
jgi:hypothetical protein